MSKPDAERAINIYRNFCRQTDQVVQYLAIARHYEHVTRFQIPKIKHAPTSLASSLEEYLADKDFEINRRQYLAQQDARKRSGKGGTNGIPSFNTKSETPSKSTATQNPPSPKRDPAQAAGTGPAPDLIDFFESIEQNQQPMEQPNAQFGFVQQQQLPQQGFAVQPTGFVSQPTGYAQQPQPYQTGAGHSTNPFGHVQQPQQQPPQLQPNFTGAGFGGYTPQPHPSFSSSLSPIPQDGVASFSAMQQQQPAQTGSTNPFRLSTMPTGASPGSFGGNMPMSPLSAQRTSTNPFARNSPSAATPFGPPSQQPLPQQQPTGAPQPPFQPQSQFGQQQQQQPGSPFALQPQPTGTNPFARPQTQNGPPQSSGMLSPLSASVTGSTNPFRQSAFVNQSTGQGWQNSSQNQGTIGGMGLGGVETQSVFPRPGAG